MFTINHEAQVAIKQMTKSFASKYAERYYKEGRNLPVDFCCGYNEAWEKVRDHSGYDITKEQFEERIPEELFRTLVLNAYNSGIQVKTLREGKTYLMKGNFQREALVTYNPEKEELEATFCLHLHFLNAEDTQEPIARYATDCPNDDNAIRQEMMEIQKICNDPSGNWDMLDALQGPGFTKLN